MPVDAQLAALLGVSLDADADTVAAAVKSVGVNDEVHIEAALDKRFFPELVPASADSNTHPTPFGGEALGDQLSARVLPSYA